MAMNFTVLTRFLDDSTYREIQKTEQKKKITQYQ